MDKLHQKNTQIEPEQPGSQESKNTILPKNQPNDEALMPDVETLITAIIGATPIVKNLVPIVIGYSYERLECRILAKELKKYVEPIHSWSNPCGYFAKQFKDAVTILDYFACHPDFTYDPAHYST
jgi:hypothetical protein